MDKKLRVLIVDDSALMRRAIEDILSVEEDIEVVGMAKDGKEACQKVYDLKPDVITMDVNMPVMNGLDAIQSIMCNLPTPIIVVSSMDPKVVAKALVVGAMDFVVVSDEVEEIAKRLIEKVRIASHIKPLRRIRPRMQDLEPLEGRKGFSQEIDSSESKGLDFVVSVGTSTGGPQALQRVLSVLPKDLKAGFLIVQHMSKGFIGGLADWLSVVTLHPVKVAQSGDALKNGNILIAPDGYHMCIDEKGIIYLNEEREKGNGFVPSINQTMMSVAESFGSRAIGVIMTGMGRDGVKGIDKIKHSGGRTIAQDEATSVIFGMNKEAILAGSIDHVVALDEIVKKLIELIS